MGAEITRYDDEIGMERLSRRPIFDRIDPRQLELIRKTIAVSDSPEHPITDSEIAHFLELCALYGLDPFAREAWIAKSKRGKLLIMVGRDGLRKIGHRNGLRVEGDVVCAQDSFSVAFIQSPGDLIEGGMVPPETRLADAAAVFERLGGGLPFHHVRHKKAGVGEARGEVVGAWARVTDRSRVERGYFDASLGEYKPTTGLEYSPWGKQVSAMMLGAVERQAIRQATPLGGLLADGEQHFVDSTAVEIGAGEGDGSEPGWDLPDELVEEVEALLTAAAEFGHVIDRAAVQMRLNGQPEGVVRAWLADTTETLAKHQEEGGGS